MKYLLDTCFVSELTEPEPNRGVTEWLQTANAEDLYLSVISIGFHQKRDSQIAAFQEETEVVIVVGNLNGRLSGADFRVGLGSDGKLECDDCGG